MTVSGVVVSTGIATGQAVHIIEQDSSVDFKLIKKTEISAQQKRLKLSITELTELLRGGQQKLSEKSENFDLIEADIMLLNDDDLIESLFSEIYQYRYTASMAVNRVFENHAAEVELIPDPTISGRANDIRTLSKRLIATINGTLAWDMSFIFEPSVILARDITPAEFAMLPMRHVKGIVLETGGLTSHTAILARAADIPAILNCDYSAADIINGEQITLDAVNGILYSSPTADDIAQIKQIEREERQRQKALSQFKDKKAKTTDGKEIKVYANVGNLSEITRIISLGTDGVGLFRTEFMLLNSTQYPNEHTQYRYYCDALHHLDGLPLTIRTLDIGADKDLSFIEQEHEENPALGIRGARFTLKHQAYFKPQLRAVLRAGNHGYVRLMFPMINQIEELETIMTILEECKTELSDENIGFGDIQIGLMIETPAAVLNLEALLPHIDFISIGTNDLTQYTMAADRSNPELSCNYPSLSPAVLKLTKMTIDLARKHKVSVSLCGELASDENAVPILLGLGLRELSVNIANVLQVKSQICNGSVADFKKLAENALEAKRITELNSYR